MKNFKVTKLLLALNLSLLLVVSTVFFIKQPAQALTSTQRQTCAANILSSAPWIQALKDYKVTNVTTNVTDQPAAGFDVNWSYIIYQNNSEAPANATEYRVIYSSLPMILKQTSSTSQTYTRVAGSVSGNATIDFYPNGGYTFTGTDTNYKPAKLVSVSGSSTPQTTDVTSNMLGSTDQWFCTVTAHNVGYHTSWTDPYMTSTMADNKDYINNNCSTFDIPCIMGKLTTNLTDALGKFFIAIFEGLQKAFVPDQEQMSAKVNDLSTFLSTKLGFLLYPFQFLANLWTTVSNGSSSCTTSSCGWTVPVMNGGTLHYDVLGLSHSDFAPIWNWFLLFLRGTTVFTFVLMLRRKLNEVLQR